MKLTKEARKLSKALLRTSFKDGLLDAAKIQHAADTVIRAKPRNYLGILKEFTRLIRLETSKRHATIQSAADLEPSEKSGITRAIRSLYGADITTEYKTNIALIGGLRIQVGSNVLDASIRSRLETLSKDLAA